MKAKVGLIGFITAIVTAALANRVTENQKEPPVLVHSEISRVQGNTVPIASPDFIEVSQQRYLKNVMVDDDPDILADEEIEEAGPVEPAGKAMLPAVSGTAIPAWYLAMHPVQPVPDEPLGQAQKKEAVQPQDLLSALAQASEDEETLGNSAPVYGIPDGPQAKSLSLPADGLPPGDLSEAGEVPLPLVTGQARGYAALSLLHPKARAVSDKQIDTLMRARVQNTYLAVLYDGTFGRDDLYLKDAINKLSSEGRNLTLELYLSNGPTMRVYDTTPITALFAKINPSEFRGLIRYDRSIRNRFLNVVRNAKAIFDFSKTSNIDNTNIAVVMLEDNLDRVSYRAMRSLAQSELGSSVEYFRSPCVGCFDGNDGDGAGDRIEEHTLQKFRTLKTGDGFTLDGTGFHYSSEASGQGPDKSSLENLIDESVGRGIKYFGLWRHNWQGVVPGQPNQHPDKRSYRPSTEAETAEEIEILRHGLQEVKNTQ